MATKKSEGTRTRRGLYGSETREVLAEGESATLASFVPQRREGYGFHGDDRETPVLEAGRVAGAHGRGRGLRRNRERENVREQEPSVLGYCFLEWYSLVQCARSLRYQMCKNVDVVVMFVDVWRYCNRPGSRAWILLFFFFFFTVPDDCAVLILVDAHFSSYFQYLPHLP